MSGEIRQANDRQIAQARRDGGHTVTVLEADKTLLAELERVMPPDPATMQPTGIVLNMAYGIQGEARYTHVPAMLELAGVPYTGATPLGHAVALDKAIAKRLLQTAGIPTPRFALMREPQDRPRRCDTADRQAAPRIHELRLEAGGQPPGTRRCCRGGGAAVRTAALVEEYIDGREVCVALLGNDPPEALPAGELSFDDRALRLVTWDDKHHKCPDEPRKLCPAPLDRALLRTHREHRVRHLRGMSRA